MSSIQAIQQTESLYRLFSYGQQTRTPSAATSSNPNTGPDTVQFSEEVLTLLGTSKAAATQEEEDTSTGLVLKESTARTAGTALVKEQKSLFGIMLETLFLADIEENAQAGAEADETGMPRKSTNPLTESSKASEIKKAMTDIASGKADVTDLPTIMAKAGSGAKKNSPAAQKPEVETA